MPSPASTPSFTHRAILVGVGVNINRAVQSQGSDRGPLDRSLKGAAADIAAVEEYLATEPHVKTVKLTATRPPGAGEGFVPIEAARSLPTLDNFCSALMDVINHGQKENVKHVYIHFSGHGTRSPRDGSLALALYDPSALGTRYMYSEELATALERIVRQGMKVTLVLDCCFSGGVYRTDKHTGGDIRFMEYDAAVDAESNAKDLLGGICDDMRNATLELDRLLNPRGYIVIAACSLDQNATELELPGARRRGALSYFLDHSLRLLRKANTQITHVTLHQHLQARFHASYPQQTPMRYGNSDDCFFQGLVGGARLPLVSIVRNPTNGCLVLSAGEAHGVTQGDEYDAYPFYVSESRKDLSSSKAVRMKVQIVESLTSNLMVVDQAHVDRIAKVASWKGEAITVLDPSKPAIYLSPSMSPSDRQLLEHNLESHPYVDLLSNNERSQPRVFTVSLGAEGSYQVQDGFSNKIPCLPVFSPDKDSSLISLGVVLGHLAMFKYFEGIENRHPDPTFETKISLQTEMPIGPDGWYEIKNEDTWELTVTNLGTAPVYFHLFNLRPSWEVCNMLSEAGDGSYCEISPGEGMPLQLRMSVPDRFRKAGVRQSEDIFKVFLTTKDTSFDAMILPDIHEGGTRQDTDSLSRFLNALMQGSLDFRSESRSKWATRNFLVRTCL